MIKIIFSEEAKKLLLNADGNFVICTIDFDNGTDMTQIGKVEDCLILVDESKTIMYDGTSGEVLQHLNMYSILQEDKENIIKRGIMRDVLFHKKE